jgi:hypothetical protein
MPFVADIQEFVLGGEEAQVFFVRQSEYSYRVVFSELSLRLHLRPVYLNLLKVYLPLPFLKIPE